MSEENQIETQEVKLNLYQKMREVMKDVEYLQKDDSISFSSTKYKAISEEKVTSTIRKSLIKNGLVILPVEQNHKREGTLSTVDTRYKIVDVDTGESEIIVSSGTGADTQDKGVGKAMTYSYKYLLLRTFAIPTGEDPDKISSAELDAKQKEQEEVNPITQKQVGTLKTKVLEFAKLRNKSDKEVYKVLKLKDVTQLSTEHAEELIGKLEGWINKAKEELEKGA